MARKLERSKSSSVETAIKRAQATQRGLAEWPATVSLPEDEGAKAEVMRNFAIIIAQREPSSWTPHDIAKAGQLARLQRLLDVEVSQLEVTGATIVTPDGKFKMAPALSGSEKLSGMVQALARSLGLTWSAAGDRRTENAHNSEFARSAGNMLVNQPMANSEAPDIWGGLQ